MEIELAKRSSLRGLKKCKECGLFNGQRSKSCKNKECPSYLPPKSRAKKSSAVKLQSDGDSTYYSVKVKSNGNSRNFVQITDKFLAENVISRTAVCFVESCQTSLEGVVNCVHQHEITEEGIEEAVPLEIDKNVLEGMHISCEMKGQVLNYTKERTTTACSRVTKTIFAITGNGEMEHVQIEESR
jgi:hypothetical protein